MPYLKRAHILPFVFRIKFKLCLQVFKIVHSLAPPYLSDFLHILIPLRSGLRSSSDFALVTTELCEILYVMCVEWNKLPYTLRTICSLNEFKTSLKTHYFNIAFANI